MDQDKAVKKAVFWLKEQDLIKPEDWEVVRRYLNWMYVAGHDHARKTLSTRHFRKIVQLSLSGKKLGEYNSIMEAAKQPGYHKLYGRNAIGNCLSGKYKHTKQGHIWKYADNGTS